MVNCPGGSYTMGSCPVGSTEKVSFMPCAIVAIVGQKRDWNFRFSKSLKTRTDISTPPLLFGEKQIMYIHLRSLAITCRNPP